MDPDHPEEVQLKRWMQAHPVSEKRTLSAEKGKATMEILAEARKKRAVG